MLWNRTFALPLLSTRCPATEHRKYVILTTACQFIYSGFISTLLQENNIRIAMGGRGCWRNTITVEQLWRSLKFENMYLHADESERDTRRGIQTWIDKYNQNRGHSSLVDDTPMKCTGASHYRPGPAARENQGLYFC